ncbi:MAG: hypothetical protein J6031_00535 [Bacteroidales bacterium]|nr:hypothetical protein [Bacteroidales bacterium]
MKHIIITVLLVCLAGGAMAQPKGVQPKENNVGITDLISDLSKVQKSKIDLITKRTAKNVENYRSQLNAVRDSIRSYMDSPNDHSAVLFPLYEREGHLQAEISKEYYRSKVAIDAVLTPEQSKMLKEKMAKNRHHRHPASYKKEYKPADKPSVNQPKK